MAKIINRTLYLLSLVAGIWLLTPAVHAQTASKEASSTINTKNESFAQAHPDQYHSWRATSEQSQREDALAEDPRLVILWAGYPFSRDYNKPRGHAYALIDVRETLRTGAPKDAQDGPLPMACWSCKSPDVARLIQEQGEDEYFHGKWAKGGPEIVNVLGCADCHKTDSPEFAQGQPALTLTRPYAARAMEAIGKPFDKASRFDQQSMVCGQCHVEYYFAGENKSVKFPWDNGTKVEDMEVYYDNIAFSDWTNSLSKAPMLKAQHPEYESDTIGGFNRVLTENRNKKGDVFITTVLFNDKTTLLHNREPIDKVPNLTLEDYQVGSNTALLDAVGDTISKMQENRKITKNNNVLFVIITDGEENSSHKYSQSKIKSMIKSAEMEDKWDFIFLGANIDAITAADSIGISRSKATGYVQDKTGYDKAYKAINNAVESKKNAAPISEEWKKEVETDAMERTNK